MGSESRNERTTPASARAGLIDSRTLSLPLPPRFAFQPIREIGGEAGWYYANMLWRIRGLIDLVFGGPGPWRGRHNHRDLASGDIVDAWRVEAFESDRLLLLKAEMKLPGQAWLRFDVEPTASGSLIRQTAVFQPAGMAGLLYWYGLLPVHTVMFRGMLRAIAAEAQRRCQEGAKNSAQ